MKTKLCLDKIYKYDIVLSSLKKDIALASASTTSMGIIASITYLAAALCVLLDPCLQ